MWFETSRFQDGWYPTLTTIWEQREGSSDELEEPLVYFKGVMRREDITSSWETLYDEEIITKSTDGSTVCGSSIEDDVIVSTENEIDNEPAGNANEKMKQRMKMKVPWGLRRFFRKNVIFPETLVKEKQYASLKTFVREWSKKLRRESTALDRKIRGYRREEGKIKSSVKKAAKRGDKDVSRLYAEELVLSRRAVGKIFVAKANLNIIQMHLQEQFAILKTNGSFQTSKKAMRAVSVLMKTPEVAQTMRELSKEMMKVGLMDEKFHGRAIFESLEEQEEIGEAADEEIDKILWDVTAGQLGRAPAEEMEGVDSEEEDQEELEKM